VRALVSYLLSLQEEDGAALDPPPSAEEFGADPDLCAQFSASGL
jgi:hypothetical protein